MTQDSSEMLVAGRELDARVDTEIFEHNPALEIYRIYPHYSTDVSAAMQAAEKINICVDLTIVCGDLGKRYFARIYPRDDVPIQVEAETMSLAICRAALKFIERKKKNA